MIILWLSNAILSIIVLLKEILLFPINTVLNVIPIPLTNILTTLLGYIDWLFPVGFMKPILLGLLTYYTILFTFWLLKKISDLPFIP